MPLLVRHPETPPGAIHTIDAELRRIGGGAVAEFRVAGDISRLVIPSPATPARTDELWKTTCFEIFSAGDGASYDEYNLSPSGAWAAYRFDGYREGMRDLEARVEIEMTPSDKGLLLAAKI